MRFELHTIARLKVRVREIQRRTIRFFGGLSNRDFEYDFAYRNVVGDGDCILDIGSTDSLLPLTLARRGFKVTTYDFRPYQERHCNLQSITGDFLDNTLPDDHFDYVVMISAIEHVGFGSYGAPVYDDGDFRVVAEARRVLKPSGKMILTFPFASKEQEITGFERWYDIERVRQLFMGMYVLAEEYYAPHTFFMGRVVKWVPVSLEQIVSVADVERQFGYQCQACYLVSPQRRQSFPRSWAKDMRESNS